MSKLYQLNLKLQFSEYQKEKKTSLMSMEDEFTNQQIFPLERFAE